MDIEDKDTSSEDTSSTTVAVIVEIAKTHKNKIKGLIVSLILALLFKVNFAPQ